VLDSLIAKRHRLARMLGYPTWADYITEDKMIGPRDAADFIERLRGTTYQRQARNTPSTSSGSRRTIPPRPR